MTTETTLTTVTGTAKEELETLLSTVNTERMNREFETMVSDSQSWPIYSLKNGITIRKRLSDNQWIASGMLPFDMATALELLTDPLTRLTWDKVMQTYMTLHHVQVALPALPPACSATASLTYTRVAPAVGGMISSRDFLDVSVVVHPATNTEDTVVDPTENLTNPALHYSLIWESIGDTLSLNADVTPFLPATATPAIRAHNYLGGCRLSPSSDSPSSCIMHYCIRSDIKGSVPAWLVDMGIGGSFDSIYNELRKAKVNKK
ncbi:hypothetical protein HK100_010181 [Physocladia obscura]|uniref:START domain-containing protein n=1 Tax=Physocladia obscura TaxID=109957 RepID=A0AAD5T5A6_9FUNG|nr:hypothetical protein HK100_010181 [Physocladia obscura]